MLEGATFLKRRTKEAVYIGSKKYREREGRKTNTVLYCDHVALVRLRGEAREPRGESIRLDGRGIKTQSQGAAHAIAWGREEQGSTIAGVKLWSTGEE